MAKEKTQKEIVDTINALTQAIKVNTGHSLADEDVVMISNKKLMELIPQVETK